MSRRAALAMSTIVLLATAGFAAAPEPATPEPVTEAKLREVFQIPVDAKLGYQGVDGKALTREEFARQLGHGVSVSLIKNPTAHTMTLKLEKPGGMPAPKAITSLPPIDLTDLKGRRIRDADLNGKPTLLSFFFAMVHPSREQRAVNTHRRGSPMRANSCESPTRARKNRRQ